MGGGGGEGQCFLAKLKNTCMQKLEQNEEVR